MVVTRGWGEEEIGSYYLMGIELQFYIEKVLSIGYTTL